MTTMPLPATDTDTRRPAVLGGVLIVLLVVPTILGFTVANAGESTPPTAAEEAAGPDGTRVLSEQDQAALISRAPLSNAPGSAQDALTRQGGEELGFARISIDSPDTGQLRVENGGTVALADGYSISITIDPYPPDSFNLDFHLELYKDGEPVPDAVIDTIWDMSVMGHGPFTTRLSPTGDGGFGAEYDFFMFGPWFVDTSVTAPGNEPIEFRLSIYVWPA